MESCEIDGREERARDGWKNNMSETRIAMEKIERNKVLGRN